MFKGTCLRLHLISALKSLVSGLQDGNKNKMKKKKARKQSLLVSIDSSLVINPDCGCSQVEALPKVMTVY